jgi:hypothetical protein
MKINKSLVASFILLVIAGAFYRVMPNRPMGFAPQFAIALFCGAIVNDKKMAIIFPLLSMVISDALYAVLYANGLTTIKGIYGGQWFNYLLFAGITVVGFYVNKSKVLHITGGSIAAVLAFFLLSNGAVWLAGSPDINNIPYPKTMAGLSSCYLAGVPALLNSLYATLLFSGLFFGAYQLFSKTLFVNRVPANA